VARPPTRVLLVDDSPEFLRAATSFFEARSDLFTIATVASGAQAITALELRSADIVLMDHDMPGMTGLEAAGIIKAAHPALPVVIVSLHDQLRHQLTGKESTVDGFICKSSFVETCPDMIAGLVHQVVDQSGGRV